VKISIIVPVFNEAALIRPFLEQLRERASGAELIVVDGGSTDETRRLADHWCDRLLTSARGRAQQLNAGARVAQGNVFWFLHVDCEVPHGCLDHIQRVLQDADVAGGFFRIRLPSSALVYRLTDSFAHYAGLLLRLRYGDHGFFCRRDVFGQVGGFPEIALMEDVEFYRNLRRRGRVVVLDERLVSNTRRYEQVGPLRLSIAYGLISLLYAFGLPTSFLARIYQRTCCRPARTRSFELAEKSKIRNGQ
jgi:rSAM/selenodomain-associated transferase 2